MRAVELLKIWETSFVEHTSLMWWIELSKFCVARLFPIVLLCVFVMGFSHPVSSCTHFLYIRYHFSFFLFFLCFFGFCYESRTFNRISIVNLVKTTFECKSRISVITCALTILLWDESFITTFKYNTVLCSFVE